MNANLLRKWVAEHQRQQRNGVAEGAIELAREVFVPVVELCSLAGALEPPAPPPIQHPEHRAKAARHMDPPGPRLAVEMPNSVTLRLECNGQDAEPASAMMAGRFERGRTG